jgi:predicted Fe-Mo cluster-binding NifX family protein
MRIAIPVNQGRFSAHFGGAEAFAFYTVDDASRTIGERRIDVPPEHGRGVFPSWIRKQGATVVLAGGMGPRAADIFAQQGIEVVLGVNGDDPDIMAQRFLDGTLEATGQACHDHSFHNCGHDHGSHDGGCHQN